MSTDVKPYSNSEGTCFASPVRMQSQYPSTSAAAVCKTQLRQQLLPLCQLSEPASLTALLTHPACRAEATNDCDVKLQQIESASAFGLRCIQL